MKKDNGLPFFLSEISLIGVYYVDPLYAQNHAHTIHQHSDKIELLYIYSGSGQYRIGKEEYTVREGDILICNANTLHGETLASGNSLQTYCCALSGLKINKIPPNTLAFRHSPVVSLTCYKDLIHTMMPNIYRLFSIRPADHILADQMAKTILTMTVRELEMQQTKKRPQRKQYEENYLVRHITDYLDQHYIEPTLRIDEICRNLHISESHLFHAFKQGTGISPKQYIILRRIGEAQSLLEVTDTPIHQIEEQLGFSSRCHLTATFKKYVGISPSAYRKHFHQKSN